MAFARRNNPRTTAEDNLDQFSDESAEQFLDSYYKALNSYRHTIASYYLPPAPDAGGASVLSIIVNGNVLASGAEVQEIFQKGLPTSYFNIEVIDCHILNPKYPSSTANAPFAKPDTTSISILVVATGTFKYTDARNAEDKAFNETLILVPNPEPPPAGRNMRGGSRRKDFVIQSQTLRLVT